jgi:hypothetical protein
MMGMIHLVKHQEVAFFQCSNRIHSIAVYPILSNFLDWGTGKARLMVTILLPDTGVYMKLPSKNNNAVPGFGD